MNFVGVLENFPPLHLIRKSCSKICSTQHKYHVSKVCLAVPHCLPQFTSPFFFLLFYANNSGVLEWPNGGFGMPLYILNKLYILSHQHILASAKISVVIVQAGA